MVTAVLRRMLLGGRVGSQINKPKSLVLKRKTQVLIDAASSTGRCNTIYLVYMTRLPPREPIGPADHMVRR